ncbi:MAG: EamA family transporter [Planctomycetota bacterium]
MSETSARTDGEPNASPGNAGSSRQALNRGRILICIAALLWSTSGLFAKAPIFDAWPEEVRGALFAFWRATFAAGILLLLVRRIQWSWKLIPTALIFAAMNWTYLSALVYSEATLAIWLQYTSPAWVFLFGLFVLREKQTVRDWILLAFAVGGLSVILFALISGANPIGIGWGMLAGVTFAAVVISLRWCREFDPAWLIFLNHVATAFLFFPVMLNSNIYPAGSQWLYLIAFGSLQMGIPYVLFTRAMKTVTSHEAAGLSLLEPLLVPVWVFVAWSSSPEYEPPAVTTIAGGALILTGLVIRYWPMRLSSRKPE